jgi:hypothetical protein
MFFIVIVDRDQSRLLISFIRIASNSLIWLVRVDLTPVLNCRNDDVKDQFRFEENFKLTHVTPRGLPPRFGRVEQLRHVNLIRNSNVGNVYTDN